MNSSAWPRTTETVGSDGEIRAIAAARSNSPLLTRTLMAESNIADKVAALVESGEAHAFTPSRVSIPKQQNDASWQETPNIGAHSSNPAATSTGSMHVTLSTSSKVPWPRSSIAMRVKISSSRRPGRKVAPTKRSSASK